MGRLLVRFVDSQLKFDSKLVKLVKQQPHLFNSAHELFEDVAIRKDTWMYIGQKLGKSDIYCEKRWAYVINRFYDEIIWMIKFNSPSPWLLYPQLDFLEEFINAQDISILCQELMEFESAIALEGI